MNQFKKENLVIVIGGDGYMLQTLKKNRKSKKFFYGVNSGSYGFLMNKFSSKNIISNLHKARMITISPLEMIVKNNKNQTKKHIAINEVSILRQSRQAASLSIHYGSKQIIKELSQTDILNIKSYYKVIIDSIASDIQINTENKLMNNLLNSGGMKGMLSTIWLVICAMSFGGAMQETGLLKRISEPVIQYAKTTGSLIATTSGTCIFFNLTTADQYLSIVVPGKMFEDSFKNKGLAAENLSRTLEDLSLIHI